MKLRKSLNAKCQRRLTLDLDKLRVFFVVAQEGSLSKSAQRLNTSQPALSRLVSLFEYQLRTKLFDRVTTGMQLTTEGKKVYEFAKRIIRETEKFEQLFFEKNDEPQGDLTITSSYSVGTEWLVPSLKEFLMDYPKINAKITLKNENINPMGGDVIIAPQFSPQPLLIQLPLFKVNTRLYASPEYLKKHGTPEKPEDLDNHRLITYRGDYYNIYASTNWILNLGRTDDTVRSSYFEIDSLHGMLSAAVHGYGIVELPDAPTNLKEGLIEVLPSFKGPEILICYIYSERKKNIPKINILYNYLLKCAKLYRN